MRSRRPVSIPLATGSLRLPHWTAGWLRRAGRRFPSREARMRLVIGLSRENVARGSGGPFGAAVFERDGGRLVAVGVNRVLASGCSHAHAEMLALALAQRVRGGWDLGAPGLPAHELVSSSEPCAMCCGALPWAGVRSLVCGARACDAEAIGFDEGDKPARWAAALARRGISVRRDVCRAEAREVLREYAIRGGTIYGPGAEARWAENSRARGAATPNGPRVGRRGGSAPPGPRRPPACRRG
jgi:tRNA(Arg) A34 adenosine deaminase TadA